ncbi:MAG: SpoIIE family protein phosphatase [Spirochaetes bacterium]|nr:SpoIIE family protein phosphatase [Spirochaetota bacterium]
MKRLLRACACAILLFSGAAGCGGEGSDVAPPVSLGKRFQYHWGDFPGDAAGAPQWSAVKGARWIPLQLPYEPPQRRGRDHLWLRVKLPRGAWESPAILTSGIHEVCQVFLEERPVYRFGRFDDSGQGIFAGYKWFHLVRLPGDFADRWLYFRFHSDFQSIGISSAVIGSQADHLRHIVKDDIFKFSIGIVFIILGLLVLFYYITRMRRRWDDFEAGGSIFIFFILASLFIGLGTIADTRIKELIVEAPLAWLYMRLAGVYIFVSAITGFIYQTFQTRFHRAILVFVIAYFSYSVLSLSLALAGLVPVMATILPFNIMVLAGISVLILIIANTFWKGNRESYLFVFGILVFIATGIRDSLVDMGMLPRYGFIQHWGMLVFVLSIGVIVVYRIVDFNRRYYGYTYEMRLARQIQMSVLPAENPDLREMTVATVYMPMVSVGGDFYAFRHMEGGRLGILISDISGHGVPSALISLMAKVIFDYESGSTEDPALLLEGMNRRLRQQMEGNFLTAGYLVIDPGEGRALFASAGHPPLMVWRGGLGVIEEFKPRGRVIGYFDELSCATREMAIGRGDKIIMITDGLLEARNIDGEQFGNGSFQRFIRERGGLPASQFAGALTARMREWILPEKRFEDDVTVVVIDIGEGPAA